METHSTTPPPLDDLLSGLSNCSISEIADARVASLKVLAVTLLKQIEVLEGQMTAGVVPPLDLQTEVRRFEASLIRSALLRTGGRQCHAARLLGMKVTTLNTKIKRLAIRLQYSDG